jgi:hypothetical protein
MENERIQSTTHKYSSIGGQRYNLKNAQKYCDEYQGSRERKRICAYLV